MLLVDAGTSYIKILDSINSRSQVIPLSEFKDIKNLNPDYTTGHNAGLFKKSKFINELVALAEGTMTITEERNFTVLDIGARDMKLVTFSEGSFEKCDWNTSCGAMVGFTIDIIMKYFNKKPEDLIISDTSLDITCGLLGITKFFDNLSQRVPIEEGLSSLIYGIAKFAWQFAGKPKSLYLSGGLSENPVFLTYLNKLVPELYPLGRYVLLHGLREIAKSKSGVLNERATHSTACY